MASSQLMRRAVLRPDLETLNLNNWGNDELHVLGIGLCPEFGFLWFGQDCN